MTTSQTSFANDVPYKNPTEKTFSCKDPRKLSIPCGSFERHPSASKLLNVTERKDTLAFLSENEKNNLFPYHFAVELTETDPLYEKNDTFYIKSENFSDNPKKNSLNVKPLFLCLTPQQIALDEKITMSIQKGDSFTEINKIFTGCLIEKN